MFWSHSGIFPFEVEGVGKERSVLVGWLVRVALRGELLLSSCDHILDSCGSGLNYHWWGGWIKARKGWNGMGRQKG